MFCSALGVMFLFLVRVILKLTRDRVVVQAAPVEAAVEVQKEADALAAHAPILPDGMAPFDGNIPIANDILENENYVEIVIDNSVDEI